MGRDTDRRPLSSVARHVVVPDGIVGSEWPSVRRTCRALGWGFDGWQDGAAQLVLAVGADGQYAADTVVLSIPRQVGKTYIIGCLIFSLCLMKDNLRVIWTAQVKDTALETFAQFMEMVERPRLRAHVARVLQGKGDESILFKNGSVVEFGARDSGFGRGRTDVDVLVFDEGQHLSTEALENMGAAQNVAANPLTFVMGTPPRPRDKGEFFSMLRQEALDGDSDGTLYIEMSADPGCDLMDRDQWRKANPSFPGRTTERALLRLRKKLKNDDSWRREALGVWDSIPTHFSPINSVLWDKLVDVGPVEDARPAALGVDMSHAREVSVAACWSGVDGVHVEEVLSGVDDVAAAEWVVRAAGRRVQVVIDGHSPAASMIPALRAKGVQVHQGSASDMARGCGLVVSDVEGGRLTHAGQVSVDEAARSVRKRPIGDAGGWGYKRSDPSARIHPMVAVTLARLGAAMVDRPKGNGEKRRVVVV